MATKLLRNRALSNTGRLIYGDLDGERWSTDGYFAVRGDVFADYKLRKGQYMADFTPDMAKLLDRGAYIPATSERHMPEDGIDSTYFKADDGPEYQVQTRYLAYVRALFPGARAHVQADGNRYDPVKFIDDRGDLIAVIMPLRG